MKVKPWDSSKHDPTRYLRLVETSKGVCLVAVGAFGERLPGGAILDVVHDGKIYLRFGVDRGLGFDLDDDGQITVVRG